MPDTVLENVAVILQPQTDSGLSDDFTMPIPSLQSANSPSTVYVSFTRDDPSAYQIASFQCVLKFMSKEVDPSTGEPEEEGYEDEYSLEDLELSAADYVVPTYVTFSSEWDRMRGGVSVTETFSLPAMESLKGMFHGIYLHPFYRSASHGYIQICVAACDSIIEILNMQPLGGSEEPQSTSVHTLQLAGLVAGGGGKVLVRSRMTYSKAQGVTLELGVRAEKQEAANLVVAAIV